MWWFRNVLAVLWLVAIGPAAWGGDIAPQNVLVLYNPAWTDGTHDGSYIADYYASARGIPASNVVGLAGLGTSEDISATDYLNIIWPQVQSALAANPNIDVIVTTKGMPLRIDNTFPNPAVSPTYEYTYTDSSGIQRTLYSDTWQPYSSLESELTRINTIGGNRSNPNWLTTALIQMGDQTYWDPNTPNPSANPYYQSTTAFSHSNPALGGMYLTSRLDGFTVANVTASINRAKNAYLVPNSSYIVADNDPNVDIADRTMVQQLKDNVLATGNRPYVYDDTTAAVTTAPGPVIGYDSHGVHSSSLAPGYIANQLNFTLANGAVFTTHESYNAYSFQPGGNVDGQGLIAEWLAKGGTAGVGNVQEPQNGPDNEANEDQMFYMLLHGYTWAEAAWSSLAQLSYVNTVVGDPLMTWKVAQYGDANLDGSVDGSDLAIVLANYNHTVADWSQGDFNDDGIVDGSDLALVLANYGKSAGGAVAAAVPEPGTFGLSVLVALVLLVRSGWWKQKRQ